MTKARDLANASTALSAVSATELGYVDGVTSAIQTQLDGKIAKTLTSTTGDIIYASAANTPARLGIGSSAQVLTVSGGVPAWSAPAGGGKVLQVVQATYSTSTTISSTSLTDSGLSATITPTLSTSKVLVLVTQSTEVSSTAANTGWLKGALLRGSTSIVATGDNAGIVATTGATGLQIQWQWAVNYLDSPATTSATTYKTQYAAQGFNSGKIIPQANSAPSQMILMEIGA